MQSAQIMYEQVLFCLIIGGEIQQFVVMEMMFTSSEDKDINVRCRQIL